MWVLRCTTVVLLASLALFRAVPGTARVIRVPEDEPVIWRAIAVAVPGDSVVVNDGIFNGATIPSGITVMGAIGARPRIISSFTTENVTDVLIQGLRLTGHSSTYGFAPIVADGEVTIRDCDVEENVTGGICATGDVTVLDSTIRDNSAGFLCELSAGILYSGEGTLTVEGCVLEDLPSAAVAVTRTNNFFDGEIVVRQCTLRNNQGGGVLFDRRGVVTAGGSVLVENSLFVGGGKPIEVFFTSPVVPLTVRGNTFIRTAGLGPSLGRDVVIENNVLTGGSNGFVLREPPAGQRVVSCNDAWGNDEDWFPFDLVGVDGNFSLPPRYCDPGGGDFRVAANSPLLPINNSCGVRIGAFGEGCGPISVRPESWGRIKSRYRAPTSR